MIPQSKESHVIPRKGDKRIGRADSGPSHDLVRLDKHPGWDRSVAAGAVFLSPPAILQLRSVTWQLRSM